MDSDLQQPKSDDNYAIRVLKNLGGCAFSKTSLFKSGTNLFEREYWA